MQRRRVSAFACPSCKPTCPSSGVQSQPPRLLRGSDTSGLAHASEEERRQLRSLGRGGWAAAATMASSCTGLWLQCGAATKWRPPAPPSSAYSACDASLRAASAGDRPSCQRRKVSQVMAQVWPSLQCLRGSAATGRNTPRHTPRCEAVDRQAMGATQGPSSEI